MALVLSLLGMALLAWIHSLGLEQKIKQKSPVAIELIENYKTDSLELLKNWLAGNKDVVKSSIEWVPKEKALDEMQDVIAATYGDSTENPFRDLLLFKLSEKANSITAVSTISNQMKDWPIVQSFNYQNELVSDISSTIKGLKLSTLLMSVLLTFMAFAIIWHLVKVYVKEKKELINTLLSLGASQSTILKPYQKLSIIHGLASSCISIGFMGVAIFILNSLAPWIYELLEIQKFFIVMLALLVIGPSIHWFLVKKHVISIINEA
jgi:cell division protein FtsX